MIDFGFEGDDWTFEGEVSKLEFKFKLSSFEWALFWSSDEDFPEIIGFRDNLESP